mgnify:CR=1 FL=1
MTSAFPWVEPARVDHVGVLVSDFTWVERLLAGGMALESSAAERVDEFGVDLLWIGGLDVPLELICPLDRDSRAGRRLRGRGAGADHIALRVESVEEALAWCRQAGVAALDPSPRPGSRGTRVAFLDPADTGGLRIELVEHPAAEGGGEA